MPHHKQINKRKVFFGFHLYRKPETPAFYSCLKEGAAYLRKHGYSLEHAIISGEPYIQAARNNLAHQFLQSDADIFIFIADDLEYSPEALLKIIETPGDVVVGAYSQHVEPANYPVHISTHPDGKPVVRDDGCIAALLVQTGFMRIKRKVFEKLAEANPDLAFYGIKNGEPFDIHYDFFPEGVYDHVWYAEDYAFCLLWRKIGGKIWIVPDLNLTHYLKGRGYPGNYHEHLMALPGGCKYKGDK